MYKILIVEDDETIAGGLKTHLERWNYQVECITDFRNVMEKYVAFDPQLVLLDIVLPFFLMDSTGVRRFGRYQKSRSYSCLLQTII